MSQNLFPAFLRRACVAVAVALPLIAIAPVAVAAKTAAKAPAAAPAAAGDVPAAPTAAAPAAAPRAARMMTNLAPDFPPGSFSDGGHYSMDDFRGKMLVLFFYEKDCPTCRGLIPKRNEVVEKFADKPVKFIAVGPNDSLPDVISYIRGTHLEMPTFADTLGVMEARYGFHISMKNIYQFVTIGPDGGIIDRGDLTVDSVANDLQRVKWKYKDAGYDPKLNGAIELLEWNQYPAGARALRPFLKTKSTAESANKLYEAVKAEGAQWLAEADQAKSTDPGQAFDLYTKVSATFTGDEMAKTADAAIKTLRTDKAFQNELAAREQYAALYPAMTRATSRQRADVAEFCLSISKKFPDTATGKKAAQLAKDLETEAAQTASVK